MLYKANGYLFEIETCLWKIIFVLKLEQSLQSSKQWIKQTFSKCISETKL